MFCLSTRILLKRDLQSLRTRSETADAFQAEGNVEACEFANVACVLQTCSRCSEKKKDTVVCAVSSWRSLMKTSKQEVFVHSGGELRQHDESGGHPTANEQVKRGSVRRQCSLHRQLLVNSWYGESKINGKMILPKKKTAREQLYSRYESGIDVARRTP